MGEAELAMERRLGASEENILVMQGNLANTYAAIGRNEEALQMRRDVYSAHLRLYGEEDQHTLVAANNYAHGLIDLRLFEDAKSVLRSTVPVARRIVGAGHDHTLRIGYNYARALYQDDGATLDDLRESVGMLEELERTARRVMGGAHPLTVDIERELRHARAALRARETPPAGDK